MVHGENALCSHARYAAGIATITNYGGPGPAAEFEVRRVEERPLSMVTLETRKPVDQLTLADFGAFPVWEYADDEEEIEGRDETWVRPLDTSAVPRESYTHVAAEFTAACGKQFAGFVTVSTLDGLPDVCQGVIFNDLESLFVSNPEAWGFEESRRHLLTAVQLSEAEMFPLSFRLRVPVAGHGQYTGGVLP